MAHFCSCIRQEEPTGCILIIETLSRVPMKRRVVVHAPAGKVTVVVKNYQGKLLNGPNDLG
jgi:hypothetical protein